MYLGGSIERIIDRASPPNVFSPSVDYGVVHVMFSPFTTIYIFTGIFRYYWLASMTMSCAPPPVLSDYEFV